MSVVRGGSKIVVFDRGKLPKFFTCDELRHRLEPTSTHSIAEEQVVDNKVEQSVSAAEMKLQEALHQALDGDWRNAISLSREAISTVPEGCFIYIKSEMPLVWSCIQRVYVEPLLIKAENSVLNWDYDETTRALENILNICQAAQLPLDYADLFIRILNVAQATSAAAGAWKGDVDAKLNQVMAGMGMLSATFEEKLEGLPYQSRVVC